MELGFDSCAFTVPDAISEAGERLKTWLEADSHGDMVWMAETAERRADPSVLWPEVQSIIMLGMNYGPAGDPLTGLADPARGNISVYARGRDYHDVIKGKLKQLGSFIVSAARRDGDGEQAVSLGENPPIQNRALEPVSRCEALPHQDASAAKSKNLPLCASPWLAQNLYSHQSQKSGQTLNASQTGALALKVFADTAPVMEKPLAAASGLGWQGKHTNLVSKEFGSWLFLGAIFTSLSFEADTKASDHCGTCHACLDICPTSAFPQPYQLDARRCISYLTIEHKGHIPLEFRKAIGNRIYGCDDCLAVCPWNKFAQDASEAKFFAREELSNPALSRLLSLDDAEFRSLFSGNPVKRIGHTRFMRNVLIAAGNSRDAGLAGIVKAKLTDASPLVRAMAVWALGELLPYDEFEVLCQIWHGQEQDEAVASEWSRLIFNESTFSS